MRSLDAAKSAVTSLDPVEYRQFRSWFEQRDAEAWDREIEEHAREGRLNALAEEALDEFDLGKCRDM